MMDYTDFPDEMDEAGVLEKAEESERAAMISNIRDTMASRGAKELIMEILGYCDMYGFNLTGSVDMAYNNGRASIGRDILGLLEEVDPTIYPRLILEKAKEIQDVGRD